MKPKQIVIVGAGFAGTNLALALAKKTKANPNFQITLVDKHDYHLLSPWLYKAAASEEEFEDLGKIKNKITIPLREIFKGVPIKLVKGESTQVNVNSREVCLEGEKKIEFDYLFLATGSLLNYSDLHDAEKYSLPFKNLNDALRVRNEIEFTVQQHRLDFNKKNLRIVIIGGNNAGISLAGELAEGLDFICWKNQYQREKVELEILEKNQV